MGVTLAPQAALSGLTPTNQGTTGASDNATASTQTVKAKADLELKVSTAAPALPSGQSALYANSTPAQNTVIFEYDVVNHGPSDAVGATFTDNVPGTKFNNVQACSGTSCSPATVTFPLALGVGALSGGTINGIAFGASVHVRVAASALESLRDGPITGVQDAASVTAQGTDPGNFSNTASESVTIWTVPSTPPNLLVSPGNRNAFFKWGPPTNFGGVPGGTGSILDFRVRTYLTELGTTPERTVTVAPDNCGTPGNTFYCALVGTDPYGPLLNNNTTYFLTVEARNVVGFSDPNTTRPSTTPTIDASAQQINNGSLSQHTGNSTLPSSADKQISFQDFPSNTTGVGTVLETNTGSNLFCAGPCFGQIVQTKLQDPFLPGIYTLTLLYDKTLIGGTGVKYGVYYAPNTTSTSGTLLKTCPANITVNVVPCSIVKLGNKGANPALKLLVYTKDPDPTTGGRTLR